MSDTGDRSGKRGADQDQASGPEPREPDRDREAVLARRRFFVASALAGVVVAGCDRRAPMVCLEVAPAPPADAGAPPQSAPPPEPPPQPCLEVAPAVCLEYAPPRDPGTSEPQGEFAEPPPDAGAPRPCLKVAADPKK